jgi:hypothetical protein
VSQRQNLQKNSCQSSLICKNGPHKFHVVDLAAAGVDSLQELIHFFVAHLLAEIGQNVSQLADPYETGHVFVENLEATTVFLGFSRVSETTGSIEDFAE